MKVIYIAGPYRAASEYQVKKNIDAAEEAALFVWANGGVALCPHKNTAFFGGACNIPDETWLEGDIELLKRCDAVYALSSWRKSNGATDEIHLANELGMPVFEQGMIDQRKLMQFLKESSDES